MTSPIPLNDQSPPPAKIGRPPQWTHSKARKLARLYMYTTLSIEKIIKVLDDGFFKPGRNSAQKTLHNMLGYDPRYLRPGSRKEMDERIGGLSASNSRRRAKERPSDAVVEENEQPRRNGLSHSPVAGGMVEEDVILSNTFPESHQLFDIFDSSPGPQCYSQTQSSPEGMCAPWTGGSGNATCGSSPGVLSQSDYNTNYVAGYQSPTHFFVPNRLTHTGTMFSASTSASTPSIRNLKKRMSESSTTFAKQVSSLLRQFTIGSETNLSKGPQLHLHTGALPMNNFHYGNQNGYGDEGTVDSLYALPGDFFILGDEHSAFPEIESFWLGQDSESGNQILERPTPEGLNLRDCFGNSFLHFIAACSDEYDYVLDAVRTYPHEQLSSVNTADQTFLHVLHKSWFANLHDQAAPLHKLLTHLRAASPGIWSVCDVYGRTFFHRLLSLVPDSQVVSSIIQSCDPTFVSRRDAFGNKPPVDGLLAAARQQQTQMLSPLAEEIISSPTSAASSPKIHVDMITQHHTGLLRIITAADTNPGAEDSCGRNGLHCLAQVIIDNDTLQEQCSGRTATPSPSSRRPPKRKFHETVRDKSEGDCGSDVAVSSPRTSVAVNNEGPLARRLVHLRGLLLQKNIDVNHYDKDGNTVLMAFVEHIKDLDEDRFKSLASIILHLLDAGARIEARNRRGETALLVAARLGRKTALKTLLERGANPNARDINGKGVLEIIDEQCNTRTAAGELPLYGRLEACRVLLTGRYMGEWGGKILCQTPSVVDEWRLRVVGAVE